MNRRRIQCEVGWWRNLRRTSWVALQTGLRATRDALGGFGLAFGGVALEQQKTSAERQVAFSELSDQAICENFRGLVQDNRAGILILDADGTVLFGNPAASQLLSCSPEELLGSPFGIPAVQDFTTEINVKRADGSTGVAAVSATETEWQSQFAYLVMLYDITERKQAEAHVRQLAFEDKLTGLPNRTLFFDRLDEAVKRMHRDRNGFALMFMDLNGFKAINDSLGHAVGDELLRAVARRLSDSMRASDTLARMGGDEFTAIFPGVTTQQAANQVAHKLLARFETPFQLEGNERYVGTSIGIAICPAHSQDSQELLRQADSAMYDAKCQHGGLPFVSRGHGADRDIAAGTRTGIARCAVARGDGAVFPTTD